MGSPFSQIGACFRFSPVLPIGAEHLPGKITAQGSAVAQQPTRRVSATGVIMVAGQKAALGRVHAGQTVTVLVSDATLTAEFSDGETRVIHRTTTQPVRSFKGQRPRTADSCSQRSSRSS